MPTITKSEFETFMETKFKVTDSFGVPITPTPVEYWRMYESIADVLGMWDARNGDKIELAEEVGANPIVTYELLKEGDN